MRPEAAARPAAAPDAAHTAIALTVQTATGAVRMNTKAPGEAAPAGMITITSGERPHIRWQVRNLDRRASTGDIAIHFLIDYAADSPASGSPVREGSLLDSLVGTSIPPRGTSVGASDTPLFERGSFTVEVELIDPSGRRLQRCSIGLVVK